MTTIAAIIPARGGSKSIPRKSLATLAGEPLMAHTIRAAHGSRNLDRVFLDTDDAEIAAHGRAQGLEVPFLRPAELATDESPVIEASLYLLRKLEELEGYKPDYAMLLQPTSPLRTTADIDAVIESAREKRAEAVVSVTPVDEHPFLMKMVAEDGRISDFVPGGRTATRRQDMPPLFILNGAIYLVRRDLLIQERAWCPFGALAYIMPRMRSLDVDEPEDLAYAEQALIKRKERGES